MEQSITPKKSRRRPSEKRRQKATVDARSRRDKEASLYKSIKDTLPLCLSKSKFSNIVLLRLTAAYIHLHRFVEQKCITAEFSDISIVNAIHGFFIIVDCRGKILFVTDTVKQYLGLSQIELLGSFLYDYLHQNDRTEVQESFFSQSAIKSKLSVVVICRFKCTSTFAETKNDSQPFKFKVVKITGRHSSVMLGDDRNKRESILLAICEPVPHSSNIEIPILGPFTFLSRLDPAFIFTDCDSQMEQLVGYSMDDVVGKSVFEYHHPEEHAVVLKAYEDLLTKGQMVTDEYRFLVKHGGFVLIMTHSTVVYHDHKPDYVVSVFSVLSGVQQRDMILSHVQSQPIRAIDYSPSNKPANETEECKVRPQSEKKKSSVKNLMPKKPNDIIIKKDEKKLAVRAPTLPRGQHDVKLWPKSINLGRPTTSKMPMGATASVFLKNDSPNSRERSLIPLADFNANKDISGPTLAPRRPTSHLSKPKQTSILENLLSDGNYLPSTDWSNQPMSCSPRNKLIVPPYVQSHQDSSSLSAISTSCHPNNITKLSEDDFDLIPVKNEDLLYGKDLFDTLDSFD